MSASCWVELTMFPGLKSVLKVEYYVKDVYQSDETWQVYLTRLQELYFAALQLNVI